MSRVLVTGGAGFIGREVCRSLSEDGHSVDVLDTREGLSAGFRLMDKRFSVLIPSRYEEATEEGLRGYDFVVHCAAICDTRHPDNDELWRVNYEAVVNLAMQMPKECKLIFLSSAAVYGDLLCSEDTQAFDPQTVYAMTKLATERALAQVFQGDPRQYLVLRPFNVYGPTEYTKKEETRSLVYRLCDAKRSTRAMGVHSLEAVRDFVHVEDVAEAVVRLVGSWPEKRELRVLNVGTGAPVSIRELVNWVDHSNINFVRNPHGNSYQSSSCAMFCDNTLDFLGDPHRALTPRAVSDLMKKMEGK